MRFASGQAGRSTNCEFSELQESAQSLWLALKCNSAHNHLCKFEPLFDLLNQATAEISAEISNKWFNFAHVGPNKHYVIQNADKVRTDLKTKCSLFNNHSLVRAEPQVL